MGAVSSGVLLSAGRAETFCKPRGPKAKKQLPFSVKENLPLISVIKEQVLKVGLL